MIFYLTVPFYNNECLLTIWYIVTDFFFNQTFETVLLIHFASEAYQITTHPLVNMLILLPKDLVSYST